MHLNTYMISMGGLKEYEVLGKKCFAFVNSFYKFSLLFLLLGFSNILIVIVFFKKYKYMNISNNISKFTKMI